MDNRSVGNQSEDTMVDLLATKIQGKVVLSIDSVNWDEAARNIKYAILLRLSTGRPVHKEKMENILLKVWKTENQVTFHKIDKEILLVTFDIEKDYLKVLNGGPWSFEGSAVIMQEWISGMTEEDFDNTMINVWVHICRLPFELRCLQFAKGIAKFAGDLVHVCENEGKNSNELKSQYVRARIRIDCNKPLVPGLFLKRPNRKPIWVAFKYERLPLVCYSCGHLTHETRNCKNRKEDKGRCFGSWLRAEDSEILKIPWSDITDENDQYMMIAVPETAPQSLFPVRVAEKVRIPDNTGSTSSLPNVTYEKVSVEMKLNGDGGKVTEDNNVSDLSITGPKFDLGFEIKLPTLQPTIDIPIVSPIFERGKAILKSIDESDVATGKRSRLTTIPYKKKKVKFRRLSYGGSKIAEDDGGSMFVRGNESLSHLWDLSSSENMDISVEAVKQPRRQQ